MSSQRRLSKKLYRDESLIRLERVPESNHTIAPTFAVIYTSGNQWVCAFYCDNIDTFLDVCFLETEQEAQDLHNARLATYKRVLAEVKATTKASNTDICFHVFTLLRTNYKELRM